KRKRVDENEERGENEGEKLQENERGVNEEAEKQITEKDEGNDEELQKKEEGDNEELQKNERTYCRGHIHAGMIAYFLIVIIDTTVSYCQNILKRHVADTKTKHGTLFVMTQLASSSPKPIYVSIKILAQFI
ncbi:unnamed protein product, partial [Brassica rapa]